MPASCSKQERPWRILVIGGTGLLGRPLVQELVLRSFSVTNMSSKPLSALHQRVQQLFSEKNVDHIPLDLAADVREQSGAGLRSAYEKGSFDLVINLAADRGGTKYDGTVMKQNNPLLNTELPAVLADLARDFNVPLFHMSTEYVWSGADNDPEGYPAVETDPRMVGDTCKMAYAAQKRASELKLIEKRVQIRDGDSVTYIRVPVLYGDMVSPMEDGTATFSIDNFLKKNDAKHDTWQRRYPTYAANVGVFLAALARKRLQHGLLHHVYHYGAQESVSKYEFLCRFIREAGLPRDKVAPEDAGEREPERRPPFDVKLNISASREELSAVDDWCEPENLTGSLIRRIFLPHFQEQVKGYLERQPLEVGEEEKLQKYPERRPTEVGEEVEPQWGRFPCARRARRFFCFVWCSDQESSA